MVTIRRVAAVVAVLTAVVAPNAEAEQDPAYRDAVVHEFGEMVAYPLIFPVDGPHHFSDTFWAPRAYPDPVHHAQDLMADKMVPVLAAATGTVSYVNWSSDPESVDPARCCTIAIRHDDGWESWYIHLNNDTPGTDDGQGWGIAPGILPGTHVQAGQLIGWVGDSGNAEYVSPHLHFELHDPNGIAVNPYQALLDAAARGGAQACNGQAATIVGDPDGDGIITGTDADDVIVGTVAADVIDAGAGDDVVCGLAGNDAIDGGLGDDVILGQRGSDLLVGGDGTDVLIGAGGIDHLAGGLGQDTLIGGTGSDTADGGEDDDVIRAGRGADVINGAGGDGADTGDGGPGSDICSVEIPIACEA